MNSASSLGNSDLVIAADFGTSSVKLAAIDAEFNICARSAASYPLDLGPDGKAEQTPQDWWNALAEAVAALKADIPDLAQRAGCLVFASQLLGVVCTDAEGNALRHCLTWLDKRAASHSKALIGGFPQVLGYNLPKLARWLYLANGAPARNGMDPITKFRWLMDHEPLVFAQTKWLLDVKDWLVLQATGEAMTSYENANMCWLMDSRKGREGWSPTLAKMTGVPLEKLPPIRAGSDVVGTVTAQAATTLGLSEGLRVLGGVSDVTAAALGSGAVEDGALHICSATSAWIAGFFPDRRLSAPHNYATITSSVDRRPLLIASQENAGSALEWAARILTDGSTPPDIASFFADSGATQADDPYFLPWLAGEKSPVDDEKLRGTFHGLALHHDQNALKRAILEGIVLNMRWAHSKVARQKGVRADAPIVLVGGMAENQAYAQMIADTLKTPVKVGAGRYAGVLGAATVAAPHMGWATDTWEAARRLGALPHTTYTPDAARGAVIDQRAARLEHVRKHILRSYQ